MRIVNPLCAAILGALIATSPALSQGTPDELDIEVSDHSGQGWGMSTSSAAVQIRVLGRPATWVYVVTHTMLAALEPGELPPEGYELLLSTFPSLKPIDDDPETHGLPEELPNVQVQFGQFGRARLITTEVAGCGEYTCRRYLQPILGFTQNPQSPRVWSTEPEVWAYEQSMSHHTEMDRWAALQFPDHEDPLVMSSFLLMQDAVKREWQDGFLMEQFLGGYPPGSQPGDPSWLEMAVNTGKLAVAVQAIGMIAFTVRHQNGPHLDELLVPGLPGVPGEPPEFTLSGTACLGITARPPFPSTGSGPGAVAPGQILQLPLIGAVMPVGAIIDAGGQVFQIPGTLDYENLGTLSLPIPPDMPVGPAVIVGVFNAFGMTTSDPGDEWSQLMIEPVAGAPGGTPLRY